jgi:hypothetical protein
VYDTGTGALKTIEANPGFPGIERVTITSYCGRHADDRRYYRLAADRTRTFPDPPGSPRRPSGAPHLTPRRPCATGPLRAFSLPDEPAGAAVWQRPAAGSARHAALHARQICRCPGVIRRP